MVNASADETPLADDRPLTDISQDALGYTEFAHVVAEAIRAVPRERGAVLALNGEWGSGKSTVLNFAERLLAQRYPQEFNVIRFNPWLFSGQQDLVMTFLQHIGTELPKSVGDRVRPYLAQIATLVGSAPTQYAGVARLVGRWIDRKPSVVSLKSKVEAELRKLSQRVVIVLDDLDRLTSSEILDMFRLVKAVGDFKNVVYVLSFDEQVVSEALESAEPLPAREYIDKIVQVPLHMPVVSEMRLRAWFVKKLEPLLRNAPDDLYDQVRFFNSLHDGVFKFLKVPRDVVRLINVLATLFPAVGQEVDFTDFVSLESLRIFVPEVYEVIRARPHDFAGHSELSMFDRFHGSKESFKAFHDDWLNGLQMENAADIRAFLCRIFPRLESIWGGMNIIYGASTEETWRRQRRAASNDVIDVYFHFGVPPDAIGNIEMRSIVDGLRDQAEFKRRLRELNSQKKPDGSTRFGEFIERLEDFTAELPLDSIGPLGALFELGDDVLNPGDTRRRVFGFGNDLYIDRVMWQCLQRLTADEREFILVEAASQGNALFIMSRVLRMVEGDVKHEDPTAEPALLTAEAFDKLKQTVCSRIESAVQDG